MVYGIYQSAAGLQLNQYRQSVLSNNLANIETVGFKHDLTLVRERQVESREGFADPAWTDPTLDRMTGGSFVAPTYTVFSQGPFKETGNQLDVALDGDGFFMVQAGNEVRYTRDGRFAVNDQGELVTFAGKHQVLDESGKPILVPIEAKDRLSIDQNGRVRAGRTEFATLGIADFADKTCLLKTGGNLFKAVGATPTLGNTSLRTKMIEGSTVEPTQAMVSMIQVSRAYQLNATLVGLADSTLGRAVNDIGRIR